MKKDASKFENGTEIISDVCIIGAGPAGVTAAREFLTKEFTVSLLESGGHAYNHEIQMLSKGEHSGDINEEQESTHLRQIGGTANNWILQMTDDEYGYRYTPLDEIDFERRDYIPNSGWPIKKTDLDPYYARVHASCGIGHYDYSADYWARGRFRPIPFNGDKVYNSVFTFGPTKKFTKEFPAEITSSSNVTLYYHATVVELLCSVDGGAVTTAVVRMFDGKEIYFKAKQFIITSNALQTPRLLLNSTKTHPNGIGNQHDNVGRYFMDHNLVPCGLFYPKDPSIINELGFYDMQGVDGTTVLGRISLNPEVMEKFQLRNLAVMLFPTTWNQHDLDAMRSVNVFRLMPHQIYTIRFPIELAKHIFDLLREPITLARHLRNVVRGRKRLVRAIYERARFGIPIFLGLGRGGWSRISNNQRKYDHLEILAIVEQSPNPNNRVTVTTEKDALGCPKAKLHYICAKEDIESVKRAQQLVGEALVETGLGHYQPPEIPAEVMKTATGLHHMLGTTRMSDDPKNGVVDRDCRVHGMRNLFIAGSAVFSTGSYANPTLTNLALSVRVSDKVISLLELLEVLI
jgi:choline dehydrogenase-like flavoprotein